MEGGEHGEAGKLNSIEHNYCCTMATGIEVNEMPVTNEDNLFMDAQSIHTAKNGQQKTSKEGPLSEQQQRRLLIMLALQEYQQQSFSYFGTGLKRDGIHDCGITIHKPKDEDFGPWKCVFAFANGVEGGYVYVTNSSLRQLVKSGEPVVEKVVALRGANVTVGCRAPASLGSCWFRHPDGSVVTPTTHGQGQFTYFGEGLSLGSCVVRFVAQTGDSGVWTCYMGVPDHIDGDIATTIEVEIIDEALVSLEKEVVVEESDAVTIGCKAVVDDGLSNCRFIHPDGWGMTFSGQKDASAVKNRYRYSGNGLSRGECYLRITEVKQEDFGQWTCAGTLEQQKHAEISITITVVQAGGLSAGAIAAIAAVSLISSAVGLSMLLGFRKQRNSSKA